MSPELITAVKERLELGYTHERITEELRGAGYDDATISQAVAAAVEHEGSVLQGETKNESYTAAGEGVRMIGFNELVRSAWAHTKQNWKLFFKYGLVLLAIGAVFGGAVFLTGLQTASDLSAAGGFSSALMAMIVILILSIVAMFMAGIANFALIRNLLHPEESFSSSFKSMLGRFWAVAFLIVLNALVIQGGHLLLILPGIALTIYLFLTTYVFVEEGKTGMAALIRSTELIYSRWWSVFGRLLYLLLIGVLVGGLCFFVVIAVWGVLNLAGATGGAVSFFSSVVIPFLLAIGFLFFVLVITAYVLSGGVALFRSLRALGPAKTFSESGVKKLRVVYIVLAVLGVLSYVLSAADGFDAPYGEFESGLEINSGAKERALELRPIEINLPTV
jgi:hypothetical protein